jgi:hypothetical protein
MVPWSAEIGLPPKFQVGDIAVYRGQQPVLFMDGTRHVKDQEIAVTESELAYFNIFQKEYELKPRR